MTTVAPLSVEQLRFYIRDNNPDDQLFTDAQIQNFLDRAVPGKPYSAIAMAMRVAASDVAQKLGTVSVLGVSGDGPGVARELREEAREWYSTPRPMALNGQTITGTTPSGDVITYAISISGNVLTLSGSDGSQSSATIPITTGEGAIVLQPSASTIVSLIEGLAGENRLDYNALKNLPDPFDPTAINNRLTAIEQKNTEQDTSIGERVVQSAYDTKQTEQDNAINSKADKTADNLSIDIFPPNIANGEALDGGYVLTLNGDVANIDSRVNEIQIWVGGEAVHTVSSFVPGDDNRRFFFNISTSEETNIGYDPATDKDSTLPVVLSMRQVQGGANTQIQQLTTNLVIGNSDIIPTLRELYTRTQANAEFARKSDIRPIRGVQIQPDAFTSGDAFIDANINVLVELDPSSPRLADIRSYTVSIQGTVAARNAYRYVDGVVDHNIQTKLSNATDISNAKAALRSATLGQVDITYYNTTANNPTAQNIVDHVRTEVYLDAPAAGGLTSVATDSTLTGDGTSGNPLSVASSSSSGGSGEVGHIWYAANVNTLSLAVKSGQEYIFEAWFNMLNGGNGFVGLGTPGSSRDVKGFIQNPVSGARYATAILFKPTSDMTVDFNIRTTSNSLTIRGNTQLIKITRVK